MDMQFGYSNEPTQVKQHGKIHTFIVDFLMSFGTFWIKLAQRINE